MHDDTPRMQWRLAVVEELIKGLDGFLELEEFKLTAGRQIDQ